jgi:3-methylfumaryl-CoA hydratase
LDLSAAGAEAVGRSVEISDVMDPARAAALHAALGLEGPAPHAGDPLPPFWHWLYFWDAQKPDALGRDGHPKLGGFLPDMGLPRRMWAGGRLSFRRPVLLGAPAWKRSTIAAATRKDGRTGPLAFLTVRHEIGDASGAAVVESQDIVYREDPSPDAPGPAVEVAPTDEMHCRRWTANSTLLFRYSALTFNGHRIHYDLDYCREVEGYPGLVVHGPLLATLMLQLAEEALPGRIASFTFRARSPVFHTEAFEVCAKPLFEGAEGDLALWVRAADGRLAMTGEAAAVTAA